MLINSHLVKYWFYTFIGFIGSLLPRLVFAGRIFVPTPYRDLVVRYMYLGIVIVCTFFVFYLLLRNDFIKDKGKLMKKIAFFLVPGIFLVFGTYLVRYLTPFDVRFDYMSFILLNVYAGPVLFATTLFANDNLFFLYASLSGAAIMTVVIKYLFSISFKKALLIYTLNSIFCTALLYAFSVNLSPIIFDLMDAIKPELFKLLK